MTDTIEIDPAVADVARRWFHFEPTGLFLAGDARYEIKKLSTPYTTASPAEPNRRICSAGKCWASCGRC